VVPACNGRIHQFSSSRRHHNPPINEFDQNRQSTRAKPPVKKMPVLLDFQNACPFGFFWIFTFGFLLDSLENACPFGLNVDCVKKMPVLLDCFLDCFWIGLRLTAQRSVPTTLLNKQTYACPLLGEISAAIPAKLGALKNGT